MELVTFQSSGFFFNLVSDQFFQVSDQWRLRKCRCRHVLRRLRSPAFDRLFCRSGRSASRDKPITRPIPQSARKKTGRASAASASDSLGPRLAPESSVAGPARVARCFAETREFPDSTGREGSSVGRGRGPLKAAWSWCRPSWWSLLTLDWNPIRLHSCATENS